MPSSMSVGATLSPSPTTNLAICLMLITYLASSVLGLMILVHRDTCRPGNPLGLVGQGSEAEGPAWAGRCTAGTHLERLLLLHHLLVADQIPPRGVG